MKRQDVIAILSARRSDLHREYGVQSLALFGSVARDEAGEGSDVDVLVEFDRPTGLFGLIRLQQHLEALLGCKVDVGTAAGLRPRIRERVLHEALRVA
ncbi:MAG: nucleotidyltransferase [Candidatus Muproteobacteria bacterium RBG_16_62_13]|uniref:Nucleotidyltransferase n=1 Tax=Candidatus Muproteobacteria bacterium RBG_16_62_13 TaxID=1817756 RepID=A0A1F6T7S3_9PROT|nr:MAG: nucleotidyltransferase [Candidatus Muproteobacteria bacterium RBG_16_62_13]